MSHPTATLERDPAAGEYKPPEWGAEFWAFMQHVHPERLPSLQRQFEENPEPLHRAIRFADEIRGQAR